MEYFLLLSVIAMLISSFSIFFIEYQNPISSPDSENDLHSSDIKTDAKEELSEEEILAMEKEELLSRAADMERESLADEITKINKTGNSFPKWCVN